MTNIDKIRAALEMARELVPAGLGMPAYANEALAALAELEKAAAEPVAWMWEDMLGISHTYVSPKRPTWPDAGASPEMAVAINVRPLYAAPPAPVAPIASLKDRQRLEAIIEVIDRYLPPDAPLTEHEAMNEIIGLVDPLPPAPVAEIREAVITDEMGKKVYEKWIRLPRRIDRSFAVSHGIDMIAAVRAELGPTLGLVELKEPTPEDGEAIYKHWERAATGCRPLCQSGRDMFDAVRAVMWPKEGL